VYPVDEGLEISEDGANLVVSSEQQWTDHNATIIRRPPSVWEENNCLLRMKYPQPGTELKFPLALKDREVNPYNYKEQMHALLNIEELAQSKILSNFNLTGNVILTTQYILSPGPLSTAKYCNGANELFAKLELNVKISEDTPAGRLILNNCYVALISFGIDGQGISFDSLFILIVFYILFCVKKMIGDFWILIHFILKNVWMFFRILGKTKII